MMLWKRLPVNKDFQHYIWMRNPILLTSRTRERSPVATSPFTTNTSCCCHYLKWPEEISALCQIKVNMFLNLTSASVQGSVATGPTCQADQTVSPDRRPAPDSQTGSLSSCHSRTTISSSCPWLFHTDFRAPTSLPWGASDFILVEGGTPGSQKQKRSLA